MLDSLPVIKNWVVWKVGDGKRIIVGRDPFLGCILKFKFSNELLEQLHSLQIYSLAHMSYQSLLNISSSVD